MPGPKIRTDIVEVYVFRRSRAVLRGHATRGLEFLQLHRSSGKISHTWQPVMGHVEEGETATQAALRELKEEAGYAVGSGLVAAWQIEAVNTYFLASIDAVMMSPGFAVEVSPDVEPKLDDSHDGARWVPRDACDRMFFWPGQRRAVTEIVEEIIAPESPSEKVLRLPLPPLPS